MPNRKTDDAGAGEVQAKIDEAEEKGYIGAKVDPLPNEHYTVDGRLADNEAGECTHTEEHPAADEPAAEAEGAV